jgi:hypothetical protein
MKALRTILHRILKKGSPGSSGRLLPKNGYGKKSDLILASELTISEQWDLKFAANGLPFGACVIA